MLKKAHPKIIVACPECDSEIIVLEKMNIGLVVECPSCVTESEIISLIPIKLAPLEEEK